MFRQVDFVHFMDFVDFDVDFVFRRWISISRQLDFVDFVDFVDFDFRQGRRGGNDFLGEHLGSVEVQQRSNVSQCADMVVASANHIRDMTVYRQRTIKLDTKQLDGTTERDMRPGDVDP